MHPPRALDLARRAGRRRAAAVVVDIDGVLSDAAEPPALPRGAAPRLAGVLRRVRRRPGDRGDARRCSTSSIPSSRSCCSPPARTACTTSPRPGSRRYEIRWDLLIMRPWGDYELSRDFKQSTVWELRELGFELRARRSRTTAATSRCSAPRASPASTSTPATTTEVSTDGWRGPGARSRRRAHRDARVPDGPTRRRQWRRMGR